MKIGVLIKQVPDSETRVKVNPSGSGIETADIKWIMNPYDEYAVEEALKLNTRFGGDVVVFSVGPKRAEDALRNAMAMGATRAVRIDDAGLEGIDSLGIGRLLAAAVKAEGLDLLFAGKQAIDDDASQVPQIVAELLDWPQVAVIDGFEAQDEKTVVARRSVGGGAREVIQVTLPAVFSADKGLNSPRYASLPGIMKAKKKPLDVKSAADLGLAASELGAGAKVKIARYSLPPARSAGKILNAGDVDGMARELVRLLHEEAKVV